MRVTGANAVHPVCHIGHLAPVAASLTLHPAHQGYLLGGLSAVLSAVAAIYTEWVMKRNNDSLHWQNTQLYSFGVVVNAFGLTVSDIYSGAKAQGMVCLMCLLDIKQMA